MMSVSSLQDDETALLRGQYDHVPDNKSKAIRVFILLSHRYGGRLLPTIIGDTVFDSLYHVIHHNHIQNVDENERLLLNKWYKLDENPFKSVYILQPVRNEDEQYGQKQWKYDEKRIISMMRKAADICLKNATINQKERDEFFISVTAKEIYQAIENNRNKVANRILCFIREITDIDHHLHEHDASKYVDMCDGEIDIEAVDYLNELKTTIKTALPPENIKICMIRWSNLKSRETYLQQFSEDFYLMVKNQIDKCVKTQPQLMKLLDDSLQYEILEHAIQCKSLTSRFFGRLDILEKIEEYMRLSDENRPCILHGRSGYGKSSIMAKVATEATKWYLNPSSVSVIIRFLGSTPASSDICKPLLNITQQISKLYNIDKNENIEIKNGNAIELKNQLETVLKLIPNEQNLIILLDSIDQLQKTDFDCLWLPLNYPKNVKCIILTMPEESGINLLGILKKLLIENYEHLFVEVDEFDKENGLNAFKSWLNIDKRKLTDNQKISVEKIFSKENYDGSPLFLSLIYDLVSNWHSYDTEIDQEFENIQNTEEAIKYVYNQLSIKHGKILFEKAISYIQ
ncbi:unnamed protein product [Didymodactylos carnosus]|uniref:NACHT domain-containing protein n=1 Tax=Didymodactylos carnosus TaxID=1234261 RepID=A0A815P893_9BILA|nr:unnamed protein product [Didymodactylos carnosus]CAF1445484.1 unnamed protein product [Didymodactylos carnosus]CAF4088461.1 unnamed protein product [Didymodactylos carnosus]CAF4320266.1 unnamed protein product [Didymodactylos carnosus]